MATESNLQLGEMTAESVFDTLVGTGVSKPDAAIIASGWIFENFGKAKRTFNYVQTFPEIEPECTAQFNRQFVHVDWVDGESVVQAETTTGEQGFNERFHNIETDLDSLGSDVAKAFACMAETRASLRKLLDEIRAEINRLNSDVHACCNRPNAPGPIVDVFPNFGGLASKFLGMASVDGKNVTMWNTPQGMLMLPAITSVGVDVLTDPRVTRVTMLARVFTEDRQIQNEFGNDRVTKKRLVDKFGNQLARDGRSIRELVSILPDNATFDNLDAMVDGVGAFEAAALRTTSGADAAIATIFGLETDANTVAKSSLDRFATVPRKARMVMISNSVATMADFVKLDAKEVHKLLTTNGVEVSPGEAAAWVAEAKTLVRVR